MREGLVPRGYQEECASASWYVFSLFRMLADSLGKENEMSTLITLMAIWFAFQTVRLILALCKN